MSVKSTIYKAELEISDIDRAYYATHAITFAQHPSENHRRLIARLVVFALFACERLEFGRGISEQLEPDLWSHDLTGNIECWIELGQPDDSSIRKACGRAQQVVVATYNSNSADIWWSKIEGALSRLQNLTVISLDSESLDQATQLIERTMRLQIVIQEGVCNISTNQMAFSMTPTRRKTPVLES
jgi:uncharacterized protein YaeQ